MPVARLVLRHVVRSRLLLVVFLALPLLAALEAGRRLYVYAEPGVAYALGSLCATITVMMAWYPPLFLEYASVTLGGAKRLAWGLVGASIAASLLYTLASLATALPLAVIWSSASPSALAAMTMSCVVTAMCSAAAVSALTMLAGRGGLVVLLLVTLAAPLAARLLQPLGVGTVSILPLLYSLVAAAAAVAALAALFFASEEALSRRLSRLARQGLLQGV